MRWLVIAGIGAAGACGRVAFDARDDAALDSEITADARPCSPVGHDEDADGIDDACDLCPQLATPQLDGDGDGVGDGCDPGTQPHAFTLFDPFTGPRADWTYDGRETFAGDVLQYRSSGTSIGTTLVQAPGRDTFELGGAVFAGAPTSRQISIHFFVLDGTGLAAGIPLGRFSYDFAMVPPTPTAQMRAVWQGESYEAAADTSSFTGSTEIALVIQQLDLALRYVVVIATGP